MFDEKCKREIVLIDKNEIDNVWGEASKLLVKCINRLNGKMTLNHLKDFLVNGSVNLWICYADGIIEMVYITCFTEYPLKKYLHIMFVSRKKGSHYRYWQNLYIYNIENYAKLMACDGVQTTSPFGGVRAYGKYGYKASDIIIFKEF